MAGITVNDVSPYGGGLYYDTNSGGMQQAQSGGGATYWTGADNNFYYGSGQQGAPVQNLGATSGGQFSEGAGGLYDNFTDSGTPSLTYSASRINDPSGGSVLGTNTAPRTPAYDQNDMKMLDSQYGKYQTLLDGLDPALASGLKNLGESETQANTNATQQNNRATRDFNISQQNSRNAKNTAINSVDNNARTMSDSLRRIIGMAGGSGGSAQLAANNAVARTASGERTGVMGSFGKNEQALQTARDDTQTDFEKLLEEIKASRNTQEQALRGGIIDQRDNFNNTMADIDLERTSLRGGDPLAAMQPYTDRFNTNQAELQALPEKYRNIASRDVSVSKPALADYLVDKQALNASNQNGGQQQYSPYKAFLDKNKEEELA